MVEKTGELQREQADEVYVTTAKEVESRWKRCPVTGDLVVAAPPGSRKVTSEEIREWLEALDTYDMVRSLEP